MSADPYRASGYITDPQSWNRYRYSRNDPINLMDPLGLEEIPVSGFASGEGVGGTSYGHREEEATGNHSLPIGSNDNAATQKDEDHNNDTGTPLALSKYAKYVEDFFVHSKGCSDLIPVQIYSQIVQVAQRANWHDVTTPAYSAELDMNLVTLGLTTESTTWTLKDLLSTNGADAKVFGGIGYNAVTSRSKNTVYVGYQFKKAEQSDAPYLAELYAAHEALHLFFQLGDRDLAMRFDIPFDDSGSDAERAGKASGAINQWLLHECSN